VDIGIFIGTVGFFFVLFLLYARTFPVIAQAEVKTILKSSGERYKKLRAAGQPLYHIHRPAAIREKVVERKSLPVAAEKEEVATLLESIGVFDARKETPDNLKKVKGIGPQMEQTLNQLGIFTFAQVGRMTDREYDLLDSITGSFPGRAKREDWAGQAQRLDKK
jgi:molybdopterin-containing oxidoreductase family membrane subunit